MIQSENGLEDDDALSRPAVEGIDATALPGRRKAEKVFGRGTRKPG